MIGLLPRYRDYKSKAEVIAGYNAGHDFTIADISSRWHGMAANNADLTIADLAPEGKVKLRYNKLTRVVIVDAVTGVECA